MEKQSLVSRRQLVTALGMAGGAAALPGCAGALSRGASAQEEDAPASTVAIRPTGGEPLAAAVARAAKVCLNLYLPPGEYIVKEAISLPSGCMLTGAGERTVLRMAKDLQGSGAFSMEKVCDVRIANLSIDGTGAKGSKLDGIRGTGLKGFTFENIYLTNCPSRAINLWGECRDGVVRNCTVTGTADRGIVLGGATHCTVEGCIVAENGSHGIWVLGDARHIAVLDNDVHDNRGQGIEVFKGCAECIVTYNLCVRNELGIHCHTVQKSLLLGNLLMDNRSNGIDCNNCEQMRIIGNHSELSGSPRTPEHKVEGSGILLFRSRDSLVVGNISINNDQGHTLRSGIQLMDEGEEGFLCARNVVVGNICFDDQAEPTQEVGMRIGRANSKCPDNLVVGNHLSRHPKGPFGGNRADRINAAHNESGDVPERHSAAPAIPVVTELPPPSDAWRGRMVLLAGDAGDTLHLCRREGGALKWSSVGL